MYNDSTNPILWSRTTTEQSLSPALPLQRLGIRHGQSTGDCMERDEEQWVKAGAVINLRGEEMMVWVKARN